MRDQGDGVVDVEWILFGIGVVIVVSVVGYFYGRAPRGGQDHAYDERTKQWMNGGPGAGGGRARGL